MLERDWTADSEQIVQRAHGAVGRHARIPCRSQDVARSLSSRNTKHQLAQHSRFARRGEHHHELGPSQPRIGAPGCACSFPAGLDLGSLDVLYVYSTL